MMDRKRADRLRFLDASRHGDIELAGNRQRIEHTADGKTTSIIFDDKGTGRQCGSCTLCCKLPALPVLEKPANHRCVYETRKGCSVYSDRPHACRTYVCGWLADRECWDLPRPDHCHYIVDTTPDFITLQDPDTGKAMKVGVVMVYCDPAFPNAHRDKRLRAYMLRMAEQYRVATQVRFDERGATIHVFPPPLSADRQWHEINGGILEPEHSVAEILGNRMTVEMSDGKGQRVRARGGVYTVSGSAGALPADGGAADGGTGADAV